MEHPETLVLEANQRALACMLAVRPVWTSIVSAEQALKLDDHTILHAGPPFADPRNLPATIRSSIVLSCLYEGWAADEARAEALIKSGKLKILPAQNHGCVTPLAAVITRSSTLVEVADAAGVLKPVWSLLSSGSAPDLRFGTRDPGSLLSMIYRDGELKSLLLKAIDTPIDLVVVANQALAAGDELHSRTQAATEVLHHMLLGRLTALNMDLGSLKKFSNMMRNSPGFFLTLWMAACRLYLSACEGFTYCSLVSRIGANGENVGLSLGGQPDRWVTSQATPPLGARFPHVNPTLTPSGVVGDSAVIDAMGFGGQMVNNASDVLASLSDYLPSNYDQAGLKIMTGLHTSFHNRRVWSGLDAIKVNKSSVSPLVNIGILAADGIHGLLGRGLYLPPVDLFREASGIN